MDSIYNVVKSFTGWRGFDQNLGFWQPPAVLNIVVGVLFLSCCTAIAYIALTAPQRPRVAQLAFLVVAAFLLVNKVWSPSSRCGWCRWRCWHCRTGESCWRG